jgi:hypothetical protein
MKKFLLLAALAAALLAIPAGTASASTSGAAKAVRKHVGPVLDIWCVKRGTGTPQFYTCSYSKARVHDRFWATAMFEGGLYRVWLNND